MKNSENIYITTTLPYVNSDPHVGFAGEIIRADSLARYYSLIGKNVFFNTGTDEHGAKIHEKAQEQGISTQEYVDGYAEKFKGLQSKLGLLESLHFIRTTDASHEKAAQEFWKKVNEAGYIYKKTYQTKYCVGCELEKTDSELDQKGQCLIHPHYEIQLIDEENYFFKFSEFGDRLLALYGENSDFVSPEFRQKEISEFVKRGLQDFSISRLKEKMPWGVAVPGDDSQVMYVWFDALVNYISTLGWPDQDGSFEKFWAQGMTYQFAGKDNLRQQSAMWQAMLMAADLPTTNQIMVGGFVMGEGGVKMSKSIGNVINPYDVINEYSEVTDYPQDVLRYYLLRHVHPFDDSPISTDLISQGYSAHLANGVGNLVSRTMNMIVSYDVQYDGDTCCGENVQKESLEFISEKLLSFEYHVVMDSIFAKVNELDQFIATQEPYKVVKVDPEKAHQDLRHVVENLARLAFMLEPFLPQTSREIIRLVQKKEKPAKPLFYRKD